MNLDPDKISVDRSGSYKPKSITITLVGDRMVDLDWALNCSTLRIPLHVNFEVRTAPSKKVALEDWQKNSATTHLLVWPVGQMLRWDAISESIATSENGNVGTVQIGNAYVAVREVGHKYGLRTDVDRPSLGEHLGIATEATIGDRVNPEKALVIALPSLGKVSLRWAANLLGMASPIGLVHHLMVVIGRAVDDAREHIARKVLAMNPRPAYLLFMGDDNLPPGNGMHMLFHAIERAKVQNVPISAVGGLYMVKHDPPQAVAWRGHTPIREDVDYRPGELLEVDGMGLDFCLIEVAALAKVAEFCGEKPMFKTVETVEYTTTEDVYFWAHFSRATGERPFVHTGCRVGHYDWKTDHVY